MRAARSTHSPVPGDLQRQKCSEDAGAAALASLFASFGERTFTTGRLCASLGREIAPLEL